jgi:hypothetical protein
MIKRYNQFVKERIDENFDENEDLGFATHDGSFDGDDSEFDETQEVEHTDHMMEIEGNIEEEEQGSDIYSTRMSELAKMLGTEVTDSNTIEYAGKQIIFPSETEMFHVDNKKFKTAEEVANHLNIEEPEMELQESKSYRNKRFRK